MNNYTYTLDKFIDSLISEAEYEHDVESVDELELTALEIVRLCVQAASSMERVRCHWCGVDTGDIDEWYMVNDAIWDRYAPADGCACIGCLEEQMGRRLTPDDFKDVPVNTDEWSHSERLRDRLTPALFDAVSTT